MVGIRSDGNCRALESGLFPVRKSLWRGAQGVHAVVSDLSGVDNPPGGSKIKVNGQAMGFASNRRTRG
jgi:hypothetical protein